MMGSTEDPVDGKAVAAAVFGAVVVYGVCLLLFFFPSLPPPPAFDLREVKAGSVGRF